MLNGKSFAKNYRAAKSCIDNIERASMENLRERIKVGHPLYPFLGRIRDDLSMGFDK
jgi:hypothetical protein